MRADPPFIKQEAVCPSAPSPQQYRHRSYKHFNKLAFHILQVVESDLLDKINN